MDPTDVPSAILVEPRGYSSRTTVRGACPHDCPDTCALLTTVEDGRAIEVRGAPDHPTTAGTLCTKVARYLERTYSPERLLHPLKRVGPKGARSFERITWDEALDTVAARFRSIIASPGGAEGILPYSYAGTMGWVQYASMDRRFFNRLGATQLERTICTAAGKMAFAHTIGAGIGTDVERFHEAKLIVIWGSNPVVSNLHLWARCQEAKRRGARLIAIDPVRSETAAKCHQHIAPLPGTDAALALAVAHVLIDANLIDHDYVGRYTVGFDAYRERVAAWTPERAAAVCGITSEEIVAFAREYATIAPAVIRLNYGMQRHAGGGNATRAIAVLPALTGAWRDAAGGLLLSASGTFPIDTRALERPDLMPTPKPRSINMVAIGDALTSASPPIQAIYVYNSNPVAVAPDSRKVVAGFSRDDLFCVVHDQFLTDTADYADIVLPATTQLEHFDVHTSYGHLYVLANNPAIAPLGEAKPNSEVFRLLAARMGFEEPCLRESDEAIAAQVLVAGHPLREGIDVATLRQRGWQRLNLPERFAPFAQGGFPTPSGKCEIYSRRLADLGLDPLPGYVAPRESAAIGSPASERAAAASPGNDDAGASRYPLAFLSPPARNFLNSSFANVPSLLAEERTPWLDIHPDDAAARGIADGMRVCAFNDRGELALTARVGLRTRPGVVVARSLWWRKLAPDGRNANELTSQATADMGGGATFYDARVDVRPA